MHVIAAKAVCFGEALKPEFKAYQQQVVRQRPGPGRAAGRHGYRIVSGGTDNHLLLVDLRPAGPQRRRGLARARRGRHHRQQERDPLRHRSPMKPSGIRIGTPAVTTRGMKEADIEQVADFIHEALRAIEDPAALHALRDRVLRLQPRLPDAVVSGI